MNIESVKAIISLLVLVVLIAAIVYWLKCLCNCDWDNGCDESQCSSCPFPCDKH